jgi:hypothetical protein
MNTLKFTEIIQETKKNKNFALNYLFELFSYNCDTFLKPIICNNPLSAIKSFIPLPSRFLLSELYSNSDKILKFNNEYQFHGTPGHRILFSDKILPIKKLKSNIKFPIPFTFPVHSNENIEILQSNIYYYEVTILDKINQSNTHFESPCVSIGFGLNTTPFNSHVGWYCDSIGYHSDDGTMRQNNTNNTAKIISKPWANNDVAGAGMIWITESMVKFFFTLNGKLIWISNEPYEIKSYYFPIIGYDHPNSISVNFSSSKFKYNIKNMIIEYSKEIISTDNSFIDSYDIGLYLNEYPNYKKEKNKINLQNIINYININGSINQENNTENIINLINNQENNIIINNSNFDESIELNNNITQNFIETFINYYNNSEQNMINNIENDES